jgi:hypothetical protein
MATRAGARKPCSGTTVFWRVRFVWPSLIQGFTKPRILFAELPLVHGGSE